MPIARKSRSERNDLIITFHLNLFQVRVTCYIAYQYVFNDYSPKAKLILLNNPRDEVEGIIQKYFVSGIIQQY